MQAMIREFRAPEVQAFSYSQSNEVWEHFKSYGAAGREYLIALYLNTKNRLIETETLTIGTINAAAAYPQDICRGALLCQADGVILIHNHPSGDPEPSLCDKSLTQEAAAACYFVGIRLLDHVIVGSNSYYSFADQGFMSETLDHLKKSFPSLGRL